MASKTYDRGKKTSRFFVRIVALLALAGVAVVVVVVVSNSLDSNSTTSTAAKHAAAKPKEHHHSAPPDDCYTVQEGDVFSNIAKHENLIQRTLIKRNGGSKFDPESIQPGQQINVTPDGCS